MKNQGLLVLKSVKGKSKMENKTLKMVCVGVYTALFILIGVTIYNFAHTPTVSTEPKEITLTESTNAVQVIGNNNVINVKLSKDYQPDVVNMNYAERILYARWENGETSYSLYEAINLLKLITKKAEKHGFTTNEGLIIVNVESDFKIDAYNRGGNAHGLTQSTPVCLEEYNLYHGTKYKIIDLYDPEINLEVGFWYYRRILTHYADCYGYISDSSPEKALRDAYIAYNIGVTTFNKIGRSGRNDLRNGVYPCNMYGSKKGDAYTPVSRYLRLASDWS